MTWILLAIGLPVLFAICTIRAWRGTRIKTIRPEWVADVNGPLRKWGLK